MEGVIGQRLGNIIAGERDYEGFNYRLLRRWRRGKRRDRNGSWEKLTGHFTAEQRKKC